MGVTKENEDEDKRYRIDRNDERNDVCHPGSHGDSSAA